MVIATPATRPEVMLLLSDIKEQPFEDRLRLVLADWLDDTGRPVDMARADLLRAQIALTQLPPESPDRFELARTVRTVQERYGQEWLGPAARWVTSRHSVRGLWSVNVTLGALRSRAMAALAGTEPWEWVEEVCLSEVAAGEIVALKSNLLLANLTGASLDRVNLRDGAAEVLAEMPWLARLVRLDLSQKPTGRTSGVNARSIRTILASPHLDRLRELRLGGASIGREGAEVLASASRAAQIEKLVLWGNQLTQDALGLLLDTGGLCRLNYLDLRSNRVDRLGADLVARSPMAAQLRNLNLSDNQIDEAGARALAESPYLEGLQALIMWGNPVGPDGASALKARFGSRVHVSAVLG